MAEECKNCGNNVDESVMRYAFEASMDRMDRANKRLAIALMIAIVVIMLTNAAWLWAWVQYDYSSEETTTETYIDVNSDDTGNANYIGSNGVIYNGTN